MESHLVRIINRLEMMAADGGNLKRNFEREGVVVAEVSFSNDPENGPVFTLRDVEARESYSFDSIDLIAMEIYDLLIMHPSDIIMRNINKEYLDELFIFATVLVLL